MLYPMLWAYQMNVYTATGFSPFQLIHGVEAVTSVECEIPSSKIAIHVLLDTFYIEERLLHLENLDQHRRDVLIANKAHKQQVKINMTKPLNLGSSPKESSSWSMTEIRNPSRQESLILCG